MRTPAVASRHSTLFATILCWSLVACSESRKPTEELPPEAPPPTGTTTPPPNTPPSSDTRERTFESTPSPAEMMELIRAHLRDPVDTPEEEQALANVEEALKSYQYVPAPEMESSGIETEEPINGSFATDLSVMRDRISQHFGDKVQVGCLARPCVSYGDFDGDSRGDMAVQVMDVDGYRPGIAFVLSNGNYALLGAGASSAIGEDLIWMRSWRVVPESAPGGKAAALALLGRPQEALVQLGRPQGDGSLEIVANWTVSPPAPSPEE
ncbi:hypothetical protein [Archangium primigenium]|uniref:hypothetical protein n=1 Tax=[Archangium] primigenium TaxID=2792470 RepID=UPI00195C4E26|nr:hypothetical protein [Archangium primigenium]MBM7116996.1 hypothetical protein [Archangium primigenium]